jgi:hypothetical protein
MLQEAMYKKTNPQQKLFGVDSQLSSQLRKRLEFSWAHLFKIEVLPILFRNEGHYAVLYGKTGRPNFSVARLLGLCLLQEFNSLSDQKALDAFSFDIRWRYALDVSDEEDYLSRRSLVEFRRRLSEIDPQMNLIRGVFDNIRDSAMKKIKISAKNQRIDSTHVMSNIRTRSRMDLFSNTLTVFLKSLDKSQFSKIPKAIQKWHKTESEGWFGLGPAEQKTKLVELARHIYKLIIIFEKDKLVKSTEPYQLLERLFKEQCTIQKESSSKKRSAKHVEITIKKKAEGETLQSPYDPDASYGHKGSGYSAQITETCTNPGKPEIITDYEVHGAARSDIAKMLPAIERLEATGLKPKTLFADGGYPSVPSALKVIEKDIDFVAPVNRSRLPEEIMGRDRFKFNSKGFVIKCPMGYRPIDHRILSANNSTRKSMHAIFDGDTCRSCKMLEQCPVRAPNHRDRGCNHRDTVGNFRLEITPELRLRDKMYSIQKTTKWKNRYRIRSGIEATMSELKRSHGFNKLRVRRAPKVCFAIACKLIACNIKRWAKAQQGLNPLFQHFISNVFARLKLIQINLVKTMSYQQITYCRHF